MKKIIKLDIGQEVTNQILLSLSSSFGQVSFAFHEGEFLWDDSDSGSRSNKYILQQRYLGFILGFVAHLTLK